MALAILLIGIWNFMLDVREIKIAVIGLGYVGLPLAVEFSKIVPVVGFDINPSRITDLQNFEDKTKEIDKQQLRDAKNIRYSNNPSDLIDSNIYIITVPTPVDHHKVPDLTALLKASEMVGKVLSKNNIVIYETTVYPGATEEECVPVIEVKSNLAFNKDFFVGYSPERINPGDKQHRLTDICKVTSGSTPAVAEFIDQLYGKIITAGTYKAPSIKTAEAAKVIENTQRDLNIALVNELAIIFNKMGIDTEAVLKAAGTKWNFLPFRPGLVGGHCIGVDPYYLTHKAESLGYHPEIILAGRRLNDRMGIHVASQMIKALLKKGTVVNDARILIMGLAFKENCPDLRNTKVIEIITELQDYGINIDVYDPCVDAKEAMREYGIEMLTQPINLGYDGIILAVAHDEIRKMGVDTIRSFGNKEGCIIYDIKYMFDESESDLRL